MNGYRGYLVRKLAIEEEAALSEEEGKQATDQFGAARSQNNAAPSSESGVELTEDNPHS